MNIQDGVFYVMVDGKQYGPMKVDELRLGIEKKHFRIEHLVWAPGFNAWRRIGDTPFLLKASEFAPSFAAAPAPVHLEAQQLGQAANPKKVKKPRRSLLALIKGSKVMDKKPSPVPQEEDQQQIKKTWRQALRQRRIILPLVGGAIVLGAVLVVAGVVGWLPLPFGHGPEVEAYDSQAIYAEDNGDWKKYPELAKEEKALAKRQEKCINALEEGDVQEATKYFFPEEQEKWEKLMADDKAGMKKLATVLASSELVFLGPDNTAKDDPRGRIASFTVVYQGQQFEIVWLKYDEQWYLYEV